MVVAGALRPVPFYLEGGGTVDGRLFGVHLEDAA